MPTMTGGHAIVAADACETFGFELAEFPASFISEIEQHFRASVIKLTNPLDLGDLFDLDVYFHIVEQTFQIEITGIERHPPGFDFGEIQHLVDQGDQVLAAAEDDA